MRRVGPLLLLAIGALILAWPASGGSRLAATGVRIGAAGGATEVGIVFTGTPRYRAFTLVGPDRVVLDLDEVEFRLADSARAGGGPIRTLSSAISTAMESASASE